MPKERSICIPSEKMELGFFSDENNDDDGEDGEWWLVDCED